VISWYTNQGWSAAYYFALHSIASHYIINIRVIYIYIHRYIYIYSDGHILRTSFFPKFRNLLLEHQNYHT
jgi:hypothetical protein